MGAWSPEWKGQHQTLAGHCALSELDTSLPLPLCFAQPSSTPRGGGGGGGGGGGECGGGINYEGLASHIGHCVLSELDTSLTQCLTQPRSIDDNGKLSGTAL